MRHRRVPPKSEEEKIRADVVAFVGKPPKKRKAAGVSDRKFVKDLDAVADFLERGTWEGAEGKHFVALYADLHFRVYGIAPADLGSKERTYAATQARRMIEKDFGGDLAEMARFVAWTWSREKGREQWRRENGRESASRIDWRLQFGPRLLVDFRLSEARRKTGS